MLFRLSDDFGGSFWLFFGKKDRIQNLPLCRRTGGLVFLQRTLSHDGDVYVCWDVRSSTASSTKCNKIEIVVGGEKCRCGCCGKILIDLSGSRGGSDSLIVWPIILWFTSTEQWKSTRLLKDYNLRANWLGVWSAAQSTALESSPVQFRLWPLKLR